MSGGRGAKRKARGSVGTGTSRELHGNAGTGGGRCPRVTRGDGEAVRGCAALAVPMQRVRSPSRPPSGLWSQ